MLCRPPPTRSSRWAPACPTGWPHRHHPYPARGHPDARVHRGRHQGDRQGGAAGVDEGPRHAGRARQRVPPVPAAGPDIVDEAGGLGKFMNWDGPTFTDSGGFQCDVARRRVQEGARDGGRGRAVRRRHRRRQAAPRARRRRRRHVQVASRRLAAPVHARGVDADPASAGRRHHVRVRRADHVAQHPRLPGAVVERTQAWAVRCIAEHEKLTAERAHRPYQALFGVVQGAQYEDLRRQAARGLESITGVSGRGFDGYGSAARSRSRIWAPSCAGSTRNCPSTSRGTCSASASPTTCSSRSRTAPTRSTASTRPGWPATPRSTTRTAASHQHRALPPGLHPDRRRVRLLHVRPLHARVHPPPVQGEGDARLDALHHPQRAVTVRLVDRIRESIEGGYFDEYKAEVLGRFYGSKPSSTGA